MITVARYCFIFLFLLTITFISCNNYGSRVDFKSDVVYYKSPVTQQQASSLGKFLQDYGYFQDKAYSVQLVKDSIYVFRMVVKPGIEKDETIIDEAKVMARELSETLFGGEPVEVDFCDSKLETVLVIPFEPLAKNGGGSVSS